MAAQSVLFACTYNAVRSPIAAALARHLLGDNVYIESVGLERASPDLFAAQVLTEIGIDIGPHDAKTFEDLASDPSARFALIISLSPEAHRAAQDFAARDAMAVEYWPTPDPTATEGSREQRLSAYRAVRDGLLARLRKRFGAKEP